MFNFGWGELVLIGIVALIAIGPKELPTVLRTLGQALGKVRRMANEFQGQFQEALREADIADLKKQADEMTSSLNNSIADVSNFDPMADTQKELEQSFDTTSPATSETHAVSADAAPAELPAPEAQAAPKSETLPEIDVPLPEEPAAVTENDFAAAEPAPARKPRKKSVKQAEGDT